MRLSNFHLYFLHKDIVVDLILDFAFVENCGLAILCLCRVLDFPCSGPAGCWSHRPNRTATARVTSERSTSATEQARTETSKKWFAVGQAGANNPNVNFNRAIGNLLARSLIPKQGNQ
jgi:hypothetical protein